MLPITKMPILHNRTYSANRKIQYIVVHDTANTGKGSGVDGHFSYFNGGNRQASADFFVDSGKIGQFNPDLGNYYMWHCGDGKGAYGITNGNSIGIEMCVNSDGDYIKTVAHTVDLVKYLMKQFNIGIPNVVRHFDASKKTCPRSMSANNWAMWNEFKTKLVATSSPAPTPADTIGTAVITANIGLNMRQQPSTNSPILISIPNGVTCLVFAQSNGWLQVNYNGRTGWVSGQYADFTISITPYRIRRSWTDASSQKGAFTNLQNAKDLCDKYDGYSVFDNTGKEVHTYVKPIPPIAKIVVYNNDIDKRMALYLAEFYRCEAVEGDSSFDFTQVQNIYGIGAGAFPSGTVVIKGYDRWDTVVAVMRHIGKVKNG